MAPMTHVWHRAWIRPQYMIWPCTKYRPGYVNIHLGFVSFEFTVPRAS